ncbi:hypothetical protein SAMN02745119_00590 [Trichlorobacter thiogenes]|uniref:Uncharacterized protein n=1 Tax=Trichlorobacter thiogenes TaxID=115783 RepID=A0A1T4KJL1_9BACT|nr:replication initiation factor domain-containing protein [Trichlorobacter thiogenes]SJZ42553.1 hypothetical protein SAMN02745119_00590 [Trichlorobacter thiogenes]
MNIAGLHQLRFYPNNDNKSITETDINTMTVELFSLNLDNFVKLKNQTSAKRHYEYAFNFKNMIIVFWNPLAKYYQCSIEINGSAFDHACINVEKICELINDKYTVSDIHAKIDTDELSFLQLWKCYQAELVTAKTVQSAPFKSKDSIRTINFGSSPQLSLYEAGKFHNLSLSKIVRAEIKYSGRHARQFFQEWRKDRANLEKLIKSYIAGQFDIKFRDPKSTDSNKSRKAILPQWKKWLKESEPRLLDKVIPQKPMRANQIKKLVDIMFKRKVEFEENEYNAIIELVEKKYSESKVINIEENQEEQLLLPLCY